MKMTSRGWYPSTGYDDIDKDVVESSDVSFDECKLNVFCEAILLLDDDGRFVCVRSAIDFQCNWSISQFNWVRVGSATFLRSGS
jgi:hypothetical protein